MPWSLTKKSLATALAKREERAIYKDSGCKGLYLIVSPRAARFEFRFKLPQSKTASTFTLGNAVTMLPADARRAAMEASEKVRRGEDPRPRAKASHGGPDSLGAVFETYKATHLARKSPRYQKDVIGDFERDVLPAFGGLSLPGITRAAWVTFFDHKSATAPGQARSMFRRVNAFLSWSEGRLIIEHNPLPKAQHVVGTAHHRDKMIDPATIKGIWRAVDGMPPRWRALVRAILATAQRSGLVRTMRWEHLDLDEGLWCPPAEDQEKATPREIPLPAPVVADIRSLNSRDSGFVFGEGSGTPDNLRKLRVRVAETVPGDWTWHDVRRSFRSSARALGISRDDAEAALGHISHRSKLDRIYDVSDNTEAARLALLRWQSYVLGLIGGDDGEKVIAIRG